MDVFTARALLGVSASDGPEAIKRAFRRNALLRHPDRGGTADEFRRLQAAQRCAIEFAPTGAFVSDRSGSWLTESSLPAPPVGDRRPGLRSRVRPTSIAADERAPRTSFGDVLARELAAA